MPLHGSWSFAASVGRDPISCFPADFGADTVDRFRRSQVESAIIRIAPSAVGGNLGSHNSSQMLAGLADHPDSTRAGAIDISPLVDFHSVDSTLLRGLQVGQHTLARESTRLAHIERMNLSPPRIADVQRSLIWRQADPIGQSEILGFNRQLAVRGDSEQSL